MSSKQKNRVILVTCLPPITNRSNAEFIDDLKKIHLQNKTPIHHIPRYKGRKIDFLKLYNAVVSRGGFRKINSLSLWPEILTETGIGEKCGNACHAIRCIYQRYLEPFEKAHRSIIGAGAVENDATLGPGASLIITDGVNSQSESELARRRGIRGPSLGPEPVAMVYHEDLHDIPNHMREKWSLTTHLLEFTEYDNVEKALISGLPNEVDFCLNSLLLMSHQSGGIHLNRNPRLIDTILASVGIYSPDSDSLSKLDHEWSLATGRNFLRYWYETVESDIGRDFLSPKVFSSVDSKSLIESLPLRYSVFNLREDMKYGDKEGHRIQLVATVIRNLVMDPHNKRFISQSEQALRFLLLCSYASHTSLRQLGLETLSVIRYPLVPPLVPVFKNLLKLCLLSENRMERIRGMQIITRLCTCDVSDVIKEETFLENAEFFANELSSKCYESIVSMLTLRDMHMVVVALDATYSLSTQGAEVCERLVQCWHCVPALLTLLTLEAQAMGADSLVGVRIMQGPVHTSNSQTQESMTASALMPPPPVPTAQGVSCTPQAGIKIVTQQQPGTVQEVIISPQSTGAVLTANSRSILSFSSSEGYYYRTARLPVNIAQKTSPVMKDVKTIKASPVISSAKQTEITSNQQGAIIISSQQFPSNFINSQQQTVSNNQLTISDNSNRLKPQLSQTIDAKSVMSTSNIQVIPVSLSSQANLLSRPTIEESIHKSFQSDPSAPTNRRDYTLWWLRKNYVESQHGSVPRVQIYSDFQKSYNTQFNNNSGILSALEFHTCVKEVFPKVEQVKVQVESGVVIHYNNIKHATQPELSLTLPCSLISPPSDRPVNSILSNELNRDITDSSGKLPASNLSNKPPSIIPVIIPASQALAASVTTSRPVVKHVESNLLNALQSSYPINQTISKISESMDETFTPTGVCVASEMTQTDLTGADNLPINASSENSRKRKSPNSMDLVSNKNTLAVHCATQTNSVSDQPSEKKLRPENNDEIGVQTSPYVLVSQDITISQPAPLILYSTNKSTENSDCKPDNSDSVKANNKSDVLIRKVLSQTNNGTLNETLSDSILDTKQENLSQHLNGIVKSVYKNGLPMETCDSQPHSMKNLCNNESNIYENGIGNIMNNGTSVDVTLPINGDNSIINSENDSTHLFGFSTSQPIIIQSNQAQMNSNRPLQNSKLQPDGNIELSVTESLSCNSPNQHFVVNTSQSSQSILPVKIIQSVDQKQNFNDTQSQKFPNVIFHSIPSQNNSPVAQNIEKNSQVLRNNTTLQEQILDKSFTSVQNTLSQIQNAQYSVNQESTRQNEINLSSNNSIPLQNVQTLTDEKQNSQSNQIVKKSSPSQISSGMHYLQNTVLQDSNCHGMHLQSQNSQANTIHVQNASISKQSISSSLQEQNDPSNPNQGLSIVSTQNCVQGQTNQAIIQTSSSQNNAIFVQCGQSNLANQGQNSQSNIVQIQNLQPNMVQVQHPPNTQGQSLQPNIVQGQNLSNNVVHVTNSQTIHGQQNLQCNTLISQGQAIQPAIMQNHVSQSQGQTNQNIVIQGQYCSNTLLANSNAPNNSIRSQSPQQIALQSQNNNKNIVHSSNIPNLSIQTQNSQNTIVPGHNIVNVAVPSQPKENVVIQGIQNQNARNFVFQGQGSQNIVFQNASQSFPNAVIQVQHCSSQYSNMQTTVTQSSGVPNTLIQNQNTAGNVLQGSNHYSQNAIIQTQNLQPTSSSQTVNAGIIQNQSLQNCNQTQKTFPTNQFIINQPMQVNQNQRVIQSVSNLQVVQNNGSHPTVSIIQQNSKLQQSNTPNQLNNQPQQVVLNQSLVRNDPSINQIQILRKSVDSTGVQHIIQQAIPVQTLNSQSGQGQAIVLPQQSLVQVQTSTPQQNLSDNTSIQVQASNQMDPQHQQKMQQVQLQLEQHQLIKNSSQGSSPLSSILSQSSTSTPTFVQSVSGSGISRSQSPQVITSSLNTPNQVAVSWVGKSAVQNQNLVTMNTSLGGQMVQVQMSPQQQQQLQQHLHNQLQQQIVQKQQLIQTPQSNQPVNNQDQQPKLLSSASINPSVIATSQPSITNQRVLVQPSQPFVINQNNPPSSGAQIVCMNTQHSTANQTTVSTTSFSQPKLQPRASSTTASSSILGVNSPETRSIKPSSKKKSKSKSKSVINTEVSSLSSSEINTDEKYLCEWDGCNMGFDDAEKVYSHVYNSHFLPGRTKQMEVCLWNGCDGHLKRAPLSLLSHLHDRHCSLNSLHNAHVKRVKERQEQLLRNQSLQTSTETSSTNTLVQPTVTQQPTVSVTDHAGGAISQPINSCPIQHHIIHVQHSAGLVTNSPLQHRIIMTSNPSVCQVINAQQHTSAKSDTPIIVSSIQNPIAVASSPSVCPSTDSIKTSKAAMQTTTATVPSQSSIIVSSSAAQSNQVTSTVNSQATIVTSSSVSAQNSKTEQAPLAIKEGPVTKHMRLTAALALRNLAQHSMSVREFLLKHELTLAEIAFSGAEASRTVCQCLALIRTLPNLS